MSGIAHMKQLLALKCSNNQETQEEINQRMEQVVSEATCKLNILYSFDITMIVSSSFAVVKIAENSTEYVNRVLDRMKAGNPTGGLEEF